MEAKTERRWKGKLEKVAYHPKTKLTSLEIVTGMYHVNIVFRGKIPKGIEGHKVMYTMTIMGEGAKKRLTRETLTDHNTKEEYFGRQLITS